MNTLIAVSIAPVGVGEELSAHVAEVVRVIRDSGLPSKTSSMFTEIEGDWDEVMAVVKRATFVLAERGIRTEVLIKADIRPGFENMMNASSSGSTRQFTAKKKRCLKHTKTDAFTGEGNGNKKKTQCHLHASLQIHASSLYCN